MRHNRFVLTAALGTLAVGHFSHGQTRSWVGPASGSYNTASNWTGNSVPNSGTATAIVSRSPGATVMLDIAPDLKNLTVGAGNQIVGGDNYIYINGPTSTINNAGTITSAVLWDSSGMTVNLTGGGTIVLADTERFGGGGTFTNVNNTFRGSGVIGSGTAALLNNSGTISADTSGGGYQVRLNQSSTPNTNTGLIRAAGGTVSFVASGSTVLSGSGTIQALNGSNVQFTQGMTIIGQTFNTSGNGTINTDLFGGKLNNITNLGNFRIEGGVVVGISGANINSGSISNFGTLSLGGGTTTISGAGSILLGNGSLSGGRIGGSGTLITANSITGTGFLGMGSIAMRTSGGIASIFSGTLNIKPGAGGMLHTGTITVPLGGYISLDPSAGSFDTSGPIITAVDPTGFNGGTFITSGGSFSATSIVVDGYWITHGAIATITNMRTVSTTAKGGVVTPDTNAKIILRAGGGTLGTSRIKGIDFSSTAWQIDLTDHALIMDTFDQFGFTYPAQYGLVKSAYAGGAWTGNGITSSLAASAASTTNKTAVGIVKASEIFATFPATFLGQPVTNSTAALTRYTYYGDSNLDGSVNIGDFAALASNFNIATNSWFKGDFNYSGTTEISDFSLLAANFNKTLAVDLPRSAAVPEPSAALAAALLLRRRRSLSAGGEIFGPGPSLPAHIRCSDIRPDSLGEAVQRRIGLEAR